MKSLTELFGITAVVKSFIITGPTDEEIKIMEEKDRKEKEYEDNLKKMENIRMYRERELINARRNAREKADTEAREKRNKDRKLHLKELNEIKTEFDLIFISFLDRETSNSTCISTGSNSYDKDKIAYGLTLLYNVSDKIDIMAKTITQINEDMLDIEAYIKYINSKSIDRISTVKLEGNTTNYSLNVEITTTTKSIYTDESYYTTRNSRRDYDDDWIFFNSSNRYLSDENYSGWMSKKMDRYSAYPNRNSRNRFDRY